MPGKGCCVITCSNYIYKTKQSEEKKTVIYHRFPKDENIRKQWMHISGKEGVWNPNNACICSEHFTENDYERDLKAELLNIPNKRRLKPNAVPTQFIPSEKILSAMNNSRSAKHIRKRKVEFANLLDLKPNIQIKIENPDDEEVKKTPNILRKRGRPTKRPRLQENSENIKKKVQSDEHEMRDKEITDMKSKYEILLQQNQELVLKNLLLEKEIKEKQIQDEKIQKEKLELEKENNEYRNLLKKQSELTRTKEDLLKKNEELSAHIVRLKLLNNANKQRIAHLNSELKKKTASRDDCIAKLKETFSKNQIDILLKEKNKVPWTAEEITQAFTIRYFSKRCYNYLRLKLKYPLPGITTLKNWTANYIGKQGLLNEAFDNFPQDLPEVERLIVLQFNIIKGSAEKDRVNDKLARPYTRIQVIQAQSLFGDWKQIVYVDFEKEFTKKDLVTIIKSFENINGKVVAFVGDCGTQKLWAELDISLNKTYFTNPFSKEKIYFFVDANHLLRLLRNWFLDTGFTWENVKTITVEHIETLLYMNGSGELGTVLTAKHVSCHGVQRRVHHLASELLSHSTADAIKKYLPDDPQVVETAEFIDLISSWYDIFSSDSLEHDEILKSGFGTHLNEQLDVLETFYNEILNMRCGSRENIMIFQRGILMSIRSLIFLQEECQNKYAKNCILASKLQQNTLETLFEYLNGKNQEPNHCLEQLRLVLMGKLQNKETFRKKKVSKKPKTKSVAVQKPETNSKFKNVSQQIFLPKHTKLIQIENQLVSLNVVSKTENLTPIKSINQVHSVIETTENHQKQSESGVRKEYVFAMVDNHFVLKENVIYDSEKPLENVEIISSESEVRKGAITKSKIKRSKVRIDNADLDDNFNRTTQILQENDKNPIKTNEINQFSSETKENFVSANNGGGINENGFESPTPVNVVRCSGSRSKSFDKSDTSFINDEEENDVDDGLSLVEQSAGLPALEGSEDVCDENEIDENVSDTGEELSEDLIAQVLESAGINVDSMQPGEYVEVVFENDNRVRIIQSCE